jgi:transcriptional regulator with XRE-family HTH domain
MDGVISELRNFRAKHNLSLGEVAYFTHLNKSTLSRFENGSIRLKYQTRAHIQRVVRWEEESIGKMLLALAIERWLNDAS